MKGLERREVVEDTLRGHAQTQPVLMQNSGIQNAASVQAPTSTLDVDIAQQLGKFAQGKLAEAVKIKQEHALIDGQMAYYQGKAFEDIKMDGDKWSLEGYRVVQSQQLASGLLTAQQQEIENGAYEMDPDQYRGHFMSRVESVLKSAPDQRIAELAREQLLRQMPSLVDKHLLSNIQHKEKLNFEELENSVDVISRDPTAIDNLITFAKGGEGSPTAGLSDTRRRAAVVSGVIKAFANDNPMAYAALSGEGLLGGDYLTTSQLNSLRSAKQKFENRRRSEYNKEFFEAEQVLLEDAAKGHLDPILAVEAASSLYAEHGITMNAHEAKEMYHKARTGVRTAAITEGALIESAGVRGDIDTQVSLVIKSLTRTESGGNSGAHRTNRDGRSFGGAMQFGQARLNDWANSTGSPRVTVSQFTNNPNLQREVERWHVKDIISHANAKGYTNLVGKKINGVTVTLSGMVAVAHLGGKGGLDKFISSGGKYNPKDQLGTSLTDYLRTHATGNADELFTPQERMDRAVKTRNQVMQRTAVENLALAQPDRDADDQLFRSDFIDESEWTRRNTVRREKYGLERTAAMIQHEADVLSEVAVSNIKNAVDEDSKQKSLEYQLGVEQARTDFNAAAEQFGKGDTSINLDAAAQEFFKQTKQLSQDTGVSIPEDEVIRDVRKISKQINKSLDAARKWHEDGVLIDASVESRTLGQLNQSLVDRAVNDYKQEVLKRSVEQKAQNTLPTQDPATGRPLDNPQEHFVMRETTKFLAQQGVIDKQLRQVTNGFLAMGPTDPEGNPNPKYVEAVQTYRDLHSVNPSLADKYIDPEYRPEIDVIMHNSAGGPIDGAIREFGVREVDTAITRDPSVFLSKVQKDVSKTVNSFLEEQDIGFWQAIWQDDADMAQWNDMTSTERSPLWSAENKELVKHDLIQELESAYKMNPRGKPTELVAAAANRVKARHTVVAGQVIRAPQGSTMSEMFFGSPTSEFADQDGIYNTIIMDWLRSEEMQAQYPHLNVDETTVGEVFGGVLNHLPQFITGRDPTAGTLSDSFDTLRTGVRPFIISDPRDGSLYIQISDPAGGYQDHLVVPALQLGKAYMKKHKSKLID